MNKFNIERNTVSIFYIFDEGIYYSKYNYIRTTAIIAYPRLGENLRRLSQRICLTNDEVTLTII